MESSSLRLKNMIGQHLANYPGVEEELLKNVAEEGFFIKKSNDDGDNNFYTLKCYGCEATVKVGADTDLSCHMKNQLRNLIAERNKLHKYDCKIKNSVPGMSYGRDHQTDSARRRAEPSMETKDQRLGSMYLTILCESWSTTILVSKIAERGFYLYKRERSIGGIHTLKCFGCQREKDVDAQSDDRIGEQLFNFLTDEEQNEIHTSECQFNPVIRSHRQQTSQAESVSAQASTVRQQSPEPEPETLNSNSRSCAESTAEPLPVMVFAMNNPKTDKKELVECTIRKSKCSPKGFKSRVVKSLRRLLTCGCLNSSNECPRNNPVVSETHEQSFQTQVAAAGSRASAHGNKQLECVVCMDLRRNTVLIPCRHMPTCETCTKELSECPICRGGIGSTLQIFNP